jgi:hypothetical protein
MTMMHDKTLSAAKQMAAELFKASRWSRPEAQAQLARAVESRVPFLPDQLRRAIAASLVAAALGWLQGCATSSQPAQASGPRFPPHLAHLASHAFFVEGCHRGRFASAERQHRCNWLHDDLQRQIAHFEEKHRRENQCVRRTLEVNGQLQSDTRECRMVQEGTAAVRQQPRRPSY